MIFQKTLYERIRIYAVTWTCVPKGGGCVGVRVGCKWALKPECGMLKVYTPGYACIAHVGLLCMEL